MFKRLALTATIVIALSSFGQTGGQNAKGTIMLVVHGGAGTITRRNMTPEMEQQYRAGMEQALRTGHAVLAKGGSSLDAVEATIRVLEDNPLFNAGKGAVFTHEGKNELDASIMDGKTKGAGSVAGVTIIRNPISAARAVMEKSKHVMMVGRGAELFATKMGLEIVDPSYFWTERRWKSLQNDLLKEQGVVKPQAWLEGPDDRKFGTVGAVALDRDGNLAAGTSTGGTTNKQYGRVGDAPIIGAGTYAENESCAVSATGHGEFFIRWTVASDIAALVRYRGMTVEQASNEVIHKKLAPVKGEGGVIVLDAKGNFAMPFNSEGMYRGWVGADGEPHVLIFKD
jgi:beta-aspartyl-peptidase (threonine type)